MPCLRRETTRDRHARTLQATKSHLGFPVPAMRVGARSEGGGEACESGAKARPSLSRWPAT